MSCSHKGRGAADSSRGLLSKPKWNYIWHWAFLCSFKYVCIYIHIYIYLSHFLFTYAHSSFLPPSFSLLKKIPLKSSSQQEGGASSVLWQCCQCFEPECLLKKVPWSSFCPLQLEGCATGNLGTAQPCCAWGWWQWCPYASHQGPGGVTELSCAAFPLYWISLN